MTTGLAGIIALAALGAVAVVAIVFLVLFIVTVRRLRALRRQVRETQSAGAALQLAVAEQSGRLRIVRELNDVAVHRVSTMVAQADGARYAGASDPSAAIRAAATIAETGRATLADMRRVMTLVRETDGAASATPQPRLQSTKDLFDVMQNAGLSVRFQETGDPFDLDPAAELAVYRILQEALGNTLKYGGEGTQVDVAFTWSRSGLALRVEDDGLRTAVARRHLGRAEQDAELAYTVEDDLRALTQEITGPGIAEMRARAELFGGTLGVTELPGVGFSVQVSFPTLKFHNGVHGVDLSRA